MGETAKLALEDGSVFEGRAFGAEGERSGEVVFNTAMTGYQEVLTDPSYKGQIVTMTAAHIGNYGVNEQDVESAHPWVEGFVSRQFSRRASNQRATDTLEGYFKKNLIIGIDEVDSRAITRKIRVEGALNGVLSTIDLDDASLVGKARGVPKMTGQDLVKDVTCREPRGWRDFVTTGTNGAPSDLRFRVALVDCGVKFNIIRSLVRVGCDVTVYPATVRADELLGGGHDGYCISNGPGDPDAVRYAIGTVRDLLEKDVPLFGICLGHQILSLALGAKTFKLPFGHHGVNHPVRREETGEVEITSQNHGFAVSEESLKKLGVEVTHINLNDRTVEGMRHKSRPVFSVQYHPEASPGPHDSRYLFDRFLELMEGR
ncbi:MAG: glutamine-hydrolyzing carbamoyl-phosphate synthase small subunit [Planctomycetota bacterium]|jgi:carbamoyl-phosphate synthase small subunit